jgi:transaldolase
MKIKIYADGSSIKEILDLYENNQLVAGFTTNPSLMKKAGVSNYESFIKEVTSKITDLPISFEVFGDDFDSMIYQAEKIASFGQNVYVKIPIVNTANMYSIPQIEYLNGKNIKLNITAVFTYDQIDELKKVLPNNKSNIVSIFAGRISDTGRDPLPYIQYGLTCLRDRCEILWASTRHVYNIYEANRVNCDIITVTPDQIKKLSLDSKDLSDYSRETVQMFYDDAASSGLVL